LSVAWVSGPERTLRVPIGLAKATPPSERVLESTSKRVTYILSGGSVRGTFLVLRSSVGVVSRPIGGWEA